MAKEDASGEPLMAPARPGGWQLWRAGTEGPGERMEGAGEVTGADGLKVLLAAAGRWLEAEEGCLLVLVRGEAAEAEVQEVLGGLGSMGMTGLWMDEGTAGLVPQPYRPERVGFLPGLMLGGGPFCAFRLEMGQAWSGRVPVREEAWEEIWRCVEEGRAQGGLVTVTVSGVAGSGKSHVLHAVAANMEEDGMTVARGVCLPSDVPGNFAVWKSLLKSLGGEQWMAAVCRQGEEMGWEAGLVREIGGLFGNGLPGIGDGRPQSLPSHLWELLPEFVAGVISRLTAGRRCACVVDDLQWMDEAGLRVIEALSGRAAPLVLIFGRRGWARPGEIALGALPLEAHGGLLAEFAESERVADSLNEYVYRISGGIPLVAKEALLVLKKRGRLRAAGGTLDFAPEVAGREPVVHGMDLAERFRDLSPELRRLLGACAVWREPFSEAQAEVPVRAAAPGLEFAAWWKAPQMAEFLAPAAGRAGQFSFQHDLLREAALSLLTEEERVAGHRAVLEWMREERSHGRSGSLAEAAFHAREAGRREEAMRLFDEAAQESLARFALREARQSCHEASLLDGGGGNGPGSGGFRLRRAKRLLVEGQAVFHGGGVKEAVPLFEQALVEYGVSASPGVFPMNGGVVARHVWLLASGKAASSRRRKGEVEAVAEAAKAAQMLAEIAYFQDDQKRSAACCVTALDLALQAGESPMLASLCAAIACPLSGRRPRGLSERYRRISKAIIARVGNEAEKMYIDHVGSLVDLDLGRWPAAAGSSGRSAAYWQGQGHARRMEEAYTHAFLVDFFQGKLREAGLQAESLRASAMRRTDRQSRLWSAMMSSLHANAVAGPEETGRFLQEASAQDGDAMTRPTYYVMQAVRAWRLGNPWQAFEWLQQADASAGLQRPVSSTQALLAEAWLLVQELRGWGPAELAADEGFVKMAQRTRQRARWFAQSFAIGQVSWLAAAGLEASSAAPGGTRSRQAFGKASQLAKRAGMGLMDARVRAWEGLAGGDDRRREEGVELLNGCGALAEVRHVQALAGRTKR